MSEAVFAGLQSEPVPSPYLSGGVWMREKLAIDNKERQRDRIKVRRADQPILKCHKFIFNHPYIPYASTGTQYHVHGQTEFSSSLVLRNQ